MTRSLDQILADLNSSHASVVEEQKQRDRITQSVEYMGLQERIDALQAEQESLLENVPDSTEEYEADVAELKTYLEENNTTDVPGWEVRTRKKTKIDAYAVLQRLEGDLDALMHVVSVKKKDLEEFAKANDRKDLRKCIRPDGFSILSVSPSQ